jgi:hypothetical protein
MGAGEVKLLFVRGVYDGDGPGVDFGARHERPRAGMVRGVTPS